MPHTGCRKAAKFGCRVTCLSSTGHLNDFAQQVAAGSSVASGSEAAVIDGIQRTWKPGGKHNPTQRISHFLLASRLSRFWCRHSLRFKHQCNVPVVIPKEDLGPSVDSGWVLPDDEHGIVQAVRQGATRLWANTVWFSTRPLQTSCLFHRYQNDVFVVGQPPALVEAYDDKALVYRLMKTNGGFMLAE